MIKYPNGQVFNKKDFADFYNQLSQIYTIETKSFKAVNNILQSKLINLQRKEINGNFS